MFTLSVTLDNTTTLTVQETGQVSAYGLSQTGLDGCVLQTPFLTGNNPWGSGRLGFTAATDQVTANVDVTITNW